MRFTKAICDPARSEVHIRDVPRIEIEVLLALIQGKIAAPPALLIPIRSITAGRPDVGSFAHGRAFRCVCPPDAVLRFSELGLQQKRQLHRAPCLRLRLAFVLLVCLCPVASNILSHRYTDAYVYVW